MATDHLQEIWKMFQTLFSWDVNVLTKSDYLGAETGLVLVLQPDWLITVHVEMS